MSAPALLEVENLSKSFGGVHAVRDVSFRGRGRRASLALIGPNGAGKTTCFNMLNGQIRPDAGRVRLRRPRHRRTAAAGRLAPRRRAHLPDHRDLRLDDGARERAGGAALASPASCASSIAPRARLHRGEADALLALVGLAEQARARLRRTRLRRPQARRTRDRPRQRAEAAADGRADGRHGAAGARRADAADGPDRARAEHRACCSPSTTWTSSSSTPTASWCSTAAA